ncbi:MAG: hypothetical protein SWJ54_00730 [Cyanobacteriota bacterium]|nr:hypothetical protein [Cyanobacteriota bacterium]
MIWMTSKLNSHKKVNGSVESSRKSAKIVHSIQNGLRRFWQFSLYYGEFIADRAVVKETNSVKSESH